MKNVIDLVRGAAAQLPAGATIRGLHALERGLHDPDYLSLRIDLGQVGREFATVTAARKSDETWDVSVAYYSGTGNVARALLRAQVLVAVAHLAQELEAVLAAQAPR